MRGVQGNLRTRQTPGRLAFLQTRMPSGEESRKLARKQKGVAMDDEAAKQLVTLENKIAAPESVLKERDPGFYQAYEARLERLEMNEQDTLETLIDLSSGPHESIQHALEE